MPRGNGMVLVCVSVTWVVKSRLSLTSLAVPKSVTWMKTATKRLKVKIYIYTITLTSGQDRYGIEEKIDKG